MSRMSMSMSRLELGQRVEYQTGGRRLYGRLMYGPSTLDFKPNEDDWCGVELDTPDGRNNGSVQGRQYFSCRDKHGIFVRAANLRPVAESRIPSNRSQSSTPATTPKTMTPSTSQISIAGSTSEMSRSTEREVTPEKRDDVRHMVEKFRTKQEHNVTENIEQTLIHKPETGHSSPAHTVSNEMIEDLKEKLRDMESKLDTLRVKRKNDMEKLKEYERLKIQCDQLQENKRQMSEKLSELSKLKNMAEKEAKKAQEDLLKHIEDTKDLTETAELAVIDKEMTENKLEQCMAELEQAKDKLEEVTLDLEIIKSEIEEKGADGAVNSYQLKQMELQNERLKDALLKLRDISAQDKSEIQAMQKELEKAQSDLQKLEKDKEKLALEVQQCEDQINDLKEQVDSALGSQEMVEELIAKNLQQEERISKLQEELDEEENLRDVNNQLIEVKDEEIADLRNEVAVAESQTRLMEQKYQAQQEDLADYESTIKKFRDLVANLKQEIHDLRTQTDSTKAAQIEQKVENFEFKNRLSDRKAFTRAIDMELRRLEVDQCQKHISFLSKFMPEAFFSRGGDHDAIQVLLFLPRISKKCEIIERQIVDKYQPIDIKEISKQSILESHDQLRQQVFTRQIVFNLISIQSVLGNYINSLQTSDSEMFLKMGALFPELIVHERTIDHYMDLLKNDKLDETVILESLERTLIYFQSLYSIHLADRSTYNHQKLVNDYITIMKSATDAIRLDLAIIQGVCSECEILKTVITCVDDVDQFCKKIKRRLASESRLCLEESAENEICDCIAITGKVISSLKVVRIGAMQLKKECDSKKLEELAKEAGGLKNIKDWLQHIMTICSQFSTALQQGDYDETKPAEPKEMTNPIDVRAQLWKAQTEEIDSLKARIESRETEINELKRALKTKIDESSEMQIRRDLAEKKLATATRDADQRVVDLQREVDELKVKLKERETESDKTLNRLNQEINDLYSNQRIMKEKLKDYSKSDLIGKIMTSKTTSNESALITQIRDLRFALRKVIDDNYNLQIKISERDLRLKPVPKMDKCKPLWLLRAQGKEDQLDTKQERLVKLTKEVNQLQNDVRMSMITEKVWDFKQNVKKQMREQALKRLDFISRYEKLEREVRDFVQTYSEGFQTGAHFQSFPAPHISKCLNEKTAKLAAVLSIPSNKAEEVSLEVTYEQLKELHRKLL